MLLTKPASFDFDLCIQDDSYVPTRFVIEEEGPSTFTEQDLDETIMIQKQEEWKR